MAKTPDNDDKLDSVARDYFRQLDAMHAPLDLGDRSIRIATSRRRRLGLAAVFAGGAVLVFGGVAAAFVVASHHQPHSAPPAATAPATPSPSTSAPAATPSSTSDATAGWIVFAATAYHYSFKYPPDLQAEDVGTGFVILDKTLPPSKHCLEYCEMEFTFRTASQGPLPTPASSSGASFDARPVSQGGLSGMRFSYIAQDTQFKGTQIVQYNFADQRGNWQFRWMGAPSPAEVARFDELMTTVSFAP